MDDTRDLTIEVMDFLPPEDSYSKWKQLMATIKELEVGQVVKAQMCSQRELEHARSHLHTLISRGTNGFGNLYAKTRARQEDSGNWYLYIQRVY